MDAFVYGMKAVLSLKRKASARLLSINQEQLAAQNRASVMQAAACKWICAAGRISNNVLISHPYLATRTFSIVRAQKKEEDAAISAASMGDIGAPTIFDKIIKKEIPSTVVYEDEKVLAFRDINPQAPVHIVVIPKLRDGLTQLSKATPKHKEILGHLMYTTAVIAKQEGIEDGYRVVINNGPTAYTYSLERLSSIKNY